MTLIIIAVTVVFSLIGLGSQEFFSRFRFNPYIIIRSGQYYRFLTYGLLHADFFHLAINMFVLYSFGGVVLDAYGILFQEKGVYYYVLLYLGGILLSVLPSFGKHKNNPYYNAVGASGAVSAVVFASILFVPTGKIMIFPIPFGIPAFIFGVLYLVYSAVMARRGKDNIGHDAHFWGAVFGVLFTLALKPGVFLHFVDNIRSFFGF